MPPTPIQKMNALIGDPRCSQGWMAGCGRLVGAHHIFKHLSCDRYSKRGRAFRGALRKFYRLETPKGRQSFYRLVAVVRKIVVKINDKSCKNNPNLVQNPSKTDQKTKPDQYKCILGTFSAPNRAQVGFRTLPPGTYQYNLVAFLAENGAPGVDFRCPGKSKIVPETYFRGLMGTWAL